MTNTVKLIQVAVLAASVTLAMSAHAQRRAVKPPVTQTTAPTPPTTTQPNTPAPVITVPVVNTCPSGQASRC